jgi:hypothetical protein
MQLRIMWQIYSADNPRLKLIAATEMLLNWLIEKPKIEPSTTEAVSEKL